MIPYRRIIKCVFFLLGFAFTISGYATSSLHAIKHGQAYPNYPQINYGNGPQAELIKRGEYLTKLGDCIACHTDTNNAGKPFAGGLAIKVPRFGTVYSTNITSDKQTGIGKWTDKQFIKTMRQGIRPDGDYLIPAFPYVYFNKITDQDLLAIKAYLDALPPVVQKNKNLRLVWPLNWRFFTIWLANTFFYF